ncbi:bifunctional diguanylate cyclase/phosphodiesterase [Raoultibacter phocaeensis]|uniref:bifunctional diguanylate cyclase/phosphodiesterase n=1 Tax=Raoultibacter phocaeensis TaxID=2479841 RepID=UPI0015D65763|nr:bifunctional diguanylate cyclase/phosphodiesterase [Raoultibacter phocaeensis]
MRELAYVDPVTGGYSWIRFEAEAVERIRSAPAGTYVLVTFNLDGFKLVNDAFGSERGDATLRHVHRTIARLMDEGNLLCRTFADHFILLCTVMPEAEIIRRMEVFSRELNRFNEGACAKYYLSTSAGAYVIDDPSLSLVQIRDRSNVARRNANTAGSDSLCRCGFYSDADRLGLLREKQLENRMGDLVESGELAAYLQPKLDLQTRTVAGAEALVRWQDPEQGLVMPDEFIPFFERNGYIVRIDLWVFEQACLNLRRWIDAGEDPVPISVNLSRAHLDDPRFPAPLVAIRERYGVPAHLLEFELTETLAATAPALAVEAVDRIRAAGFKSSIDDFGSGYSSLGMLKDVRADTLKLDREFLHGAGDEKAAAPQPALDPGAPPGPCSARPAQPATAAATDLAHPATSAATDPARFAPLAAAPALAAPQPAQPATYPSSDEPQPGGSPRASAVVESVVAMARRLGMQVVCEGVESKEQLEALAAMGCDLAQGFAVAPALPPAEFERMAFGRAVG